MNILEQTVPKIRNVVCTANLEQKVDIVKLSRIACGIYDEAIYGGRCGYIKTPDMDGRVTIFASGKMISIGGKSIKMAIDQLNQAKFFLVKEKMINEMQIIPKIQNIVATIDVGQLLPIKKLASKLPGAVYDPDTFAGLILMGLESNTFLIFASGKIVSTGCKSSEEVSRTSFELLQKIKKFNSKKLLKTC